MVSGRERSAGLETLNLKLAQRAYCEKSFPDPTRAERVGWKKSFLVSCNGVLCNS